MYVKRRRDTAEGWGVSRPFCTHDYISYSTIATSANTSLYSSKILEDFTMPALPQISEAEFEVMKIVWKHAPISTNEITDRLTKTTSWSPKTIQTLIKRLVMKGALSYEKQSRVFVYTPIVNENDYISQESTSFLKRFYDGNITAMLTCGFCCLHYWQFHFIPFV